MTHTPTRFSISYRDGGYYVSIPNYEGGEVVTADAHDDLVAALQKVVDNNDPVEMRLVARKALAKAGATS